MATCANCGGDVSDRADFCRHCSAPQRPDAGKDLVAPPKGSGLSGGTKSGKKSRFSLDTKDLKLPKFPGLKRGKKEAALPDPFAEPAPTQAAEEDPFADPFVPPTQISTAPPAPPPRQRPVARPPVERHVVEPPPPSPVEAPPVVESGTEELKAFDEQGVIEEPEVIAPPPAPRPRPTPRAPSARPSAPRPSVPARHEPVREEAAPEPAKEPDDPLRPVRRPAPERSAPERPKVERPPPPRPPRQRTPLVPPPDAPLPPPPPPPPAIIEERESPFAVAGRLIAVSAIIGFALGFATILFLVLVGFFGAADDPSAADFAAGIFGGVIVIGVLVFAVMIGVVMGALDGIFAARSTVNAREARLAGALSGALGHLALVVTLGFVLWVGFTLLWDEGGTTPDESTGRPTTAAEIAECEQNFGAGASICQPDEPSNDSPVPVGDIAKAAAGLIPAGIAGAAVASIMTPRKKR